MHIGDEDLKRYCSFYFSKLQIFASDSFLELTEYSREEILGRNCRCATKLFNVMFSKYENEKKKKIIIYSAVPIPYSKNGIIGSVTLHSTAFS